MPKRLYASQINQALTQGFEHLSYRFFPMMYYPSTKIWPGVVLNKTKDDGKLHPLAVRLTRTIGAASCAVLACNLLGAADPSAVCVLLATLLALVWAAFEFSHYIDHPRGSWGEQDDE